MEAPVSAESLPTIYQTAQRHIAEDSTVLIDPPIGEWIRIWQNFCLHGIMQKTIKIVTSACGTEESQSHKSPFALADYRLNQSFVYRTVSKYHKIKLQTNFLISSSGLSSKTKTELMTGNKTVAP
jgi:hypothetical protein